MSNPNIRATVFIGEITKVRGVPPHGVVNSSLNKNKCNYKREEINPLSFTYRKVKIELIIIDFPYENPVFMKFVGYYKLLYSTRFACQKPYRKHLNKIHFIGDI